MPLEEFLAANREFLSSSKAERAPRDPQRRLAVVTCMDGRLTKLLPLALGLQRGDALMIRTAGNVILPNDQSIVRSVSVGVFLLGVEEVLVVGHTDCRMGGDVMPLLDGMRKSGVTRDALGSGDVREFFGFIASPEANVRDTVRSLRESPLMPGSVKVYGLMIDTDSGAVRVIVDADHELQATPAAAVPVAEVAEPIEVLPVAQIAEEPVARPVVKPAPARKAGRVRWQ